MCCCLADGTGLNVYRYVRVVCISNLEVIVQDLDIGGFMKKREYRMNWGITKLLIPDSLFTEWKLKGQPEEDAEDVIREDVMCCVLI